MIKLRITFIVTAFIFSIALLSGIYVKTTYKDFNNENEPLEEFYIGLIPENLFSMQLRYFDEDLDKSNIIIAARCVDSSKFRPKCSTQEVEVVKVFKGDLLNGEIIEVAKFNSDLYKVDINGKSEKGTNMSFTNEMQIGEYYLIFLDRKLDSHTEESIFIQPEGFIIAPIFCYKEIVNKPYESITNSGNWIDYKTVKDNEYFLMSQKNVDEMNAYKEKVLAKYPLD